MKIDAHIHPAGTVSLLLMLLFLPIETVLTGVIAIFLHEGGHLLAMKCCKVRRCTVEWTPLGFMAQVSSLSVFSPIQQILIASAGPVVSAVAAALCYPLKASFGFFLSLFTANLSLLLINSLPVLPLDGARVLLALASTVGLEKRVEKGLLFLSYILGLLLIVLGIWGITQGVFNPFILAIGPYLAYAAKKSTQDSRLETVRLLNKRNQMRNRKIVPAEVYISDGEPDSVEMLRVLQNVPIMRCAVLQIQHSSQITEQLTEGQMINRLFEHL